MLDIKLIRSNPELVKENIKKKFQDEKLPLVDEVLELDAQFRASKGRGDELRQQRNTISKEIGKLMSQGKKDEAQEVKKQVQAIAGELEEMERKEAETRRTIDHAKTADPQALAQRIRAVLDAYGSSDNAQRNALLKSVIDQVWYSKAKKTKPNDFDIQLDLKPF